MLIPEYHSLLGILYITCVPSVIRFLVACSWFLDAVIMVSVCGQFATCQISIIAVCDIGKSGLACPLCKSSMGDYKPSPSEVFLYSITAKWGFSPMPLAFANKLFTSCIYFQHVHFTGGSEMSLWCSAYPCLPSPVWLHLHYNKDKCQDTKVSGHPYSREYSLHMVCCMLDCHILSNLQITGKSE